MDTPSLFTDINAYFLTLMGTLSLWLGIRFSLKLKAKWLSILGVIGSFFIAFVVMILLALGLGFSPVNTQHAGNMFFFSGLVVALGFWVTKPSQGE